MPKRKSISQKIRFEVFKRDSFQCQYCGASAPDVVLHVDHIKPVSKGGDNDITNLVTSCQKCNSGKSDRELDDDAVIQKQREQLEILNERRNQLEMMLEWRESMRDIADQYVDACIDALERSAGSGAYLNDSGKRKMRSYVKRYGASDVLDAIDAAAENYLRYDDRGRVTAESLSVALEKIPGIINMKSAPEYMRDLYYIRGIVRKRVGCRDGECLRMLIDAYESGVSTDELRTIAVTAPSEYRWKMDVEAAMYVKEGNE